MAKAQSRFDLGQEALTDAAQLLTQRADVIDNAPISLFHYHCRHSAASARRMFRLRARTFLLQLITLCTALGVLWAPVAEAAECSDEPEVASLIEQHGESGSEESTPEKHGTCAHGHCHHASQAVRGAADSAMLMTAATLLAGITDPSLDGSSTELATPPPRA